MKKIKVLALCLVLIGSLSVKPAPAEDKYLQPPAVIAKLISAPLTPVISVSPDKSHYLLLALPGYPLLKDLAQPELKLAGKIINPATNGPGRLRSYNGLTLKKLNSDKQIEISSLKDPRINYVNWAPDSKRVAFTLTETNKTSLGILEVNSGKIQLYPNISLNATNGLPYQWFSDSKNLLINAIPENRGKEPERPLIPSAPIIQESTGQKAPNRTFQNLLANPADEKLFEYYFTSQLLKLGIDDKVTKLGQPGIFVNAEPSPDGKFILAEQLHRPFSYLVPMSRFPLKSELWDNQGRMVKLLHDAPLAENIPSGFDAVQTGPRNYNWRADTPATIYWSEAQDQGDPSVKADIRDKVFTLAAPFSAKPQVLIELESRLGEIYWKNEQLALISESWWKTRKEKTWLVEPGKNGNKPRLIFDLSTEDRYNDPGTPLLTNSSFGTKILAGKEKTIYLSGEGAGPEGEKPFLAKLNLENLETAKVWQSQPPEYEKLLSVIDPEKLTLLTSIESTNKQPDYFFRDLGNGKLKQLTNFPHPAPELKNVKKELVKYQREDGVELSGTLYLPDGYRPEKDGPLPMLMWAYPREFKSAAAAGQVNGSPHEFIRIGWGSPLFWVLRGYAVFDGPTMPIIGVGDQEPNDTYVKQLVSSAKAAVDEMVKRGITAPGRIAIGGHSYGAFMTANLLAHSDLFAAGIARSGAYNRTLTPFGFQSEERTFWDAPDVYAKMSPFNNADKINEPLLLIHGQADDNPGTFPLQSERLYNALKGLGKKARLVMLPLEMHSYQAQESILHMLREMDDWLEKNIGKK